MKYKNKQEFIRGCNEDGDFRDSVGREVTELDLKKYDILPDFEGKYSGAQKFILCSKIRKEEGHEFYDKEPLAEVSFLKSSPSKSISPGIQRLLLVYLSDKFQEDIKHLRKALDIPESGFGPRDANKCAKLFMEWKKIMTKWRYQDPKKFAQEVKFLDKTYLDSLIFAHYGNKIKNYKFETKQLVIDPEHMPELFMMDAWDLFDAYNLDIFSLGPLCTGSVIVFGLWNPSFISLFSKPIPISYQADSLNPEDQLNIVITGPIKKRELVEYINKNWPEIKNTLDKIFKPVGGTKNLLRDYLVIQLKKQGKSANEIKNILKRGARYDLKVDQVRQILKRTKKKIKQLESA